MNGILIMISIVAPPTGEQLYLDPGSGSFILQIILATLLGGFVLIKTYWNKIKEGVSGLFSKKREGSKDELNE